ncbi:MAG: response regulator [Clostridia bacterium]|nr:response regulator [Clostridia bacterium]
MIRVFIAEDEPPTLRRVKRMIEQADPVFTVVATAKDGEEALTRLDAERCDVLFTDIRMPVMDGLKLMDAVRAKYPDCQIVILSGHQEFDYAAHAIRAGAVDYLLKPVSQEDIDTLAKRLITTHSLRERQRLTKQLSAVVNRSESGNRVPSENEDAETRFSVCLFCAGPMALSDAEELFMEGTDWELNPPEATLHNMEHGYQGFSWSFTGNNQAERILIYQQPVMPSENVALRLHARLQERSALPISCSCAVHGVQLSEIGLTITELRKALLSSIVIGAGAFVVVPSNARERKQIAPFDDHQTATTLAEWLQSGRFSTEGAYWRVLSARMAHERWTQQRIYSLFTDAITLMESEKVATVKAQASRLVADALSTALSHNDLTVSLAGLAVLLNANEQPDTRQQQLVAERVAKFLGNHYSEPINNQTLGREFGYVPSYVSLLFRKEYGVSPAKYLTKLRLDTAKRLMRKQPDSLIRDVAAHVGFKSPHHFSHVFKKIEGIWPTEYPPAPSSDRR